MFLYIALPTDVATWINAFIPSSGVGLVTSFLITLVDLVYLNMGEISVWLPYVMLGICIIEMPIFILWSVRNYIRYSEK